MSESIKIFVQNPSTNARIATRFSTYFSNVLGDPAENQALVDFLNENYSTDSLELEVAKKISPLVFGWGIQSLADNLFYHMNANMGITMSGFPSSATAPTTVPQVVPANCTIKYFVIVFRANASSENIGLRYSINAGAWVTFKSDFKCQPSGGPNFYAIVPVDVPLLAGDALYVSLAAPAWSSNPTNSYGILTAFVQY